MNTNLFNGVTTAESSESDELCREATRILRSHAGVPSNFEAKIAVRADSDAVKNAREATSKGRCIMYIFYIPPLILLNICTGMICATSKSYKILGKWLQNAEEDIYVYGDGGFAVLNGGKVKEWTPITNNSDYALNPCFKTFYYSSGSRHIVQPVLMVQKKTSFGINKNVGWGDTHVSADVRSGKTKQVWFVGGNDFATLQARCGGGGISTFGMQNMFPAMAQTMVMMG